MSTDTNDPYSHVCYLPRPFAESQFYTCSECKVHWISVLAKEPLIRTDLLVRINPYVWRRWARRR